MADTPTAKKAQREERSLGSMKTQFARKILVVDDEPIIRTLIAERLRQEGFEVEVAPDALSAKRVMLKFDPDALVVDLDLGDGPSGTELIAALHALNPALGFLLLSNYVPTPAELGAATTIGYLNKRDVSDITRLIDSLEQVLTQQAADAVLEERPSKLSGLTKKQLEILSLVAKGLGNAEIAEKREVSLRAVEQSIHRIYQELGLSGESGSSRRVSAARIFTIEQGLRRDSK